MNPTDPNQPQVDPMAPVAGGTGVVTPAPVDPMATPAPQGPVAPVETPAPVEPVMPEPQAPVEPMPDAGTDMPPTVPPAAV